MNPVPPACHRWSVVCLCWLRKFNRLLASAHFYFVLLTSFVRPGMFVGEPGGIFLFLVFSWCAYHKRFSPALSSHCGFFVLIWCVCTL